MGQDELTEANVGQLMPNHVGLRQFKMKPSLTKSQNCNSLPLNVVHVQRSAKKYANLAKQEPGRTRQNW